jgi:hypothetical protein
MSSGLGSLHKVLKDETRIRIVLLLYGKGFLSYVDLMRAQKYKNRHDELSPKNSW